MMELLFVTEENADLLRVEGQNTTVVAKAPAAVEFFPGEQYACIQVGSQRLHLSKQSMLTRSGSRTWLFPAEQSGVVFAVVLAPSTPLEELETFQSVVSHFTTVLSSEELAMRAEHPTALPTQPTATAATLATAMPAMAVAAPATPIAATPITATPATPTPVVAWPVRPNATSPTNALPLARAGSDTVEATVIHTAGPSDLPFPSSSSSAASFSSSSSSSSASSSSTTASTSATTTTTSPTTTASTSAASSTASVTTPATTPAVPVPQPTPSSRTGMAGSIEKAGTAVAQGIVYSADMAGSGLRSAGGWIASKVGPKENKEVSESTKRRLSSVRNVTSTGLEVSRGLLSASVSVFKLLGNKAAERVRDSNMYQNRSKKPASAVTEIGAAVVTAGVDVYHSLRTAAIVLAAHTEGAAVDTATKIYGEEYGQNVVRPIAGGMMDVGLSVANIAALASSKIACVGEVGVEALDHLASKAEWSQGEILIQGWVKERGTVNITSWKRVWATLRPGALHLAASPEYAARSAHSHAVDLAQYLERLPESQLLMLTHNVNQQLREQGQSDEKNEDVKMMHAVREYMRKDFVNTVIRYKRENETASFEQFLADSFPENILLAPDGSVDWIDKRVLNEEWKGTYEKVQKEDTLFALEGPPGVIEEAVGPRRLSHTWLQLHQFVAEAIQMKDPAVVVGSSSAVVESKSSSSFLQNVVDGTNNAIASVTQSLAELKEKWIPMEDIQDVESTPGSVQGVEASPNRFRIHTRDGMIHNIETESPALCAQYQTLLLRCMAATRRSKILTVGQKQPGLLALRLLRDPASAPSLPAVASSASVVPSDSKHGI